MGMRPDTRIYRYQRGLPELKIRRIVRDKKQDNKKGTGQKSIWDTVKSDRGRSQIGFYYVPEGGKDE